MKILFTIGAFGRGGKERRMASLISFLAHKKVEIGLIASERSQYLAEIRGFCSKLYNYKPGNLRFNLSEHRRALIDFGPDIVHSWNPSNTTLAILATINRQCAIITSEVTNARAMKVFSPQYLITRFNFAFSNMVLSNSKAGLRAKRAPRRKSRVIYNGYDFNRLEGIDKEKYSDFRRSGTLNVIMAARFTREKDYSTVLMAAAMAAKSGSKMRFFLAGDGPELDSMREKASVLGLENVTFLGYVMNIDEVLHQMDVGVLATDARNHQEGISNSLVECMAHGKPVIATDGLAISEIVRSGWNGFVVRERGAGEILDCLLKFERKPEILGKMGENARKTVEDRFEIGRMGEEFIAIYNEVLKR